MRRTPAADERARPAPIHPPAALSLPALSGTVTVSRAAVAAPDQLTIALLDQWLQAIHAQLLPLRGDPPTLNQAVATILAQDRWATVFHAVQQLGTTRPAPPLDAVFHAVRGTFTALALAMELLVTDGGDGDDGGTLLALVQAQRGMLHRLISDVVCPAAVDEPDAGGAEVYGMHDAILS